MEMYPKNNLYKLYKENVYDRYFSTRIPDVTKKRTLEVMNLAVNACSSWNSSLDIGGGSGHYSIPLLHKFKKSVVVEVDKHEEHIYLKNKYPHFEYHNNFVEKVDFKEKFDFILLADIFEHIEDPEVFIEKLSSLQNKDGVIYILTPNPLFCGPAEKSGIYYLDHIGGHHKHYFPHEIISLLNTYGYTLAYLCYEEGPIRQVMKRILKGFSRRDRRLNDSFFIYRKLLAPIFEILYTPILFLVEWYVNRVECLNKDNKENTMGATYIFKKSGE